MRNQLIARIPAPVGRALDINGHVFGAITVVAMAVLLVVAARQQQTAVVAVLGLGLATVAVSRLWSAVALHGVSFSRVLDKHAVFPGEELNGQIRVANNKALPMPWVEATQEIPSGFDTDAPCETDFTGQRRLIRSFSLPWYSRITWNERLTGQRRGCYTLHAPVVSSGDSLGLYPRAIEDSSVEQVTVYPRLYPVHHLSTLRTDASGERVGVATLQEDPTRMRGIRDYASGDSLRRVHWKATASQSDLKVKLFEPAAVSRVQMALVADGFCTSGEDDFELAVSAIASLARFCVEHQQQVGFSSNAQLGDRKIAAGLSAGGGGPHLHRMLELLAHVQAARVRPFPVFARELRTLASARAALIVVTGQLERTQIETFEQLARLSSSFRVIVVSSTTDSPRTAFPCTFVRSPDDLLTIGGRAA